MYVFKSILSYQQHMMTGMFDMVDCTNNPNPNYNQSKEYQKTPGESQLLPVMIPFLPNLFLKWRYCGKLET